MGSHLLLTGFIILLLSIMTSAVGHAQSRKPTAREIAAIHACATKHKDDVDAGEQQCLFKLVADPCMAPIGSAPDQTMADCFRIEGAIWNDFLNESYKNLLATLDDDQAGKARAMQRAWIAYRDTTCQFYDD